MTLATLPKALYRLIASLLVSTAAMAAEAPAPAPAAAATAAAAPLDLTADEVKGHLGHVIDWYLRLAALERAPALANDDTTRERLRQATVNEVRIAFKFGRAAANLVVADPTNAAETDAGEGAVSDPARYERIGTRMASRAEALQAQLTQLNARIAQAPRKERPTLLAQRAQLTASLNLSREVQETVQGLRQFAATSSTSASGEKGLLGDISDMERQVPEARRPPVTTARAATPVAAEPVADSGTAGEAAKPAASDAFRAESAGLIALGTEWLSLRGANRQHTHFIDATDELSEALDKISRGITSQVRELLRTAMSGATSTDAVKLEAARVELESATARFKQLATLLVPLSEEGITIDTARGILEERRAAVSARAATIARLLAVRVGILLASVALIIGISAIWRRATFRYLSDTRRRRQFLALRRVATGVALTIVILMAFLSEIGSLATYIGFLTAGIAVALQNVILAVVAYFFLIGRYGVRVGDRVTMAGVTGRVVDIGLVRIYLAELAGPELQSTGRMIVLSNAVIFQPSALFKQIPGADYAWHTVTLTLAPSADLEIARSRLQKKADEVFETYRESIEKHVKAAQHQIDFESAPPSPEVHARFSANGLELSVRYPVRLRHAAEIDQSMTHALRDALDEEPRLELATKGAPILAPSTT